MTNQQGAPEALRPIQRFNNVFGLMNPEGRGLYVRYEDHVAALVEAQQPAPSAAAAPDGWEGVIHEIRSGLVDSEPSGYDNSGYRSFAGTVLDAVEDGLLKLTTAPTPQADSQPAPVLDREAVIRAAVAAMPHTNPMVADDLLGGFTMHTEADDVIAIFEAGRAARAPADSVAAPQQEAQEPFGYVNTHTGQFFKDVEQSRKNNEGHWRTVFTAPQPAPLSDDVVKDAARHDTLLAAAGIALEVLQKHRQMKGEWPVGELGRRAYDELTAAIAGIFAARAALAAQGGK